MIRKFALTFMFGVCCASAAFATDTGSGVDPAAALTRLMDGNKRFVEGTSNAASQYGEKRSNTAKGQTPFAIVVSCSDSRVPPEVVFDQAIGDLFVVRVAGNTVNPAALGSIEYAVEHLGARLILVMGHERCGAVTAAVNGGHLPGHIGAVTEPIQPVIAVCKSGGVEKCIAENALHVANEIRNAGPILNALAKSGKIVVNAAKYDLDDGIVEILAE